MYELKTSGTAPVNAATAQDHRWFSRVNSRCKTTAMIVMLKPNDKYLSR